MRGAMASIATGLAALSALALVVGQGGRFNDFLDLPNHFAPLTTAMGGLGGAAGWALGRRRSRPFAAACGIVALLLGVGLLAPEYAAAPQTGPSGGERFRIIQFNALADNRRADEAVTWIRSQRPDVIVLEEGGVVRRKLLATGDYYVACRDCLASILSRRKPLSDNAAEPRVGWSPSVSVASFADARGPYTVAGMHLAWPVRPRVNREEFARVLSRLDGLPRDRMILAGDFNSTPWSFVQRRYDRQRGLERRTRGVFSWPAERVSHNRLPALAPFLPIDHVYAGSGWRLVEVAGGPRLGSDHYPVLFTLAPV